MACKPKEQDYVLSIDQASNAAGVSLWRNGQRLATATLRSAKSSDPFGKRLATQMRALEAWLDQLRIEKIQHVVFEGVRSRLVLVTVGAFCAARQLQSCRLHPKHSFVESTSWKRWAQKRGARGPLKDIKGVQALIDIGYPVEGINTDDEADSILQYLTWRDRP